MSQASQRHKLEIHGVSNDNIDLGTAPKQIREDNVALNLPVSTTYLALDLKPYFEPHGPYGYTYALTVPIAGLSLDNDTGILSGTTDPGSAAGSPILTVTHTASTDTSDIVIDWSIA